MSICIRKYRVQHWSYVTNIDFHYYAVFRKRARVFHVSTTLPPTIMFQWKMGPSNSSFLRFRVIFHFHDYGRKGPCWTYSITNSSFFPETSTQRNYRGGSIHRRCACVMQQHILPQICLSVWRVSHVFLNGFDPQVCKSFWVILNRFNQLGKYCKVKSGYRDMDSFLLVLMNN